jgi:hypothetical protein
MTERAQTVHDYLLGIVIVLLTVGVALGIVGNAYAPFFDPVDNEEQTMAENLADEAIEVNQTMWGEQTVALANLNETLEDNFGRLKDWAGIPDWKRANVTIFDENRDIVRSGGANPTDEPAGSQSRVIMSVESDDPCHEGCRMVVRVW